MELIDIAERTQCDAEDARLWAAPLGPYQTNCYLYTPNGRTAWIIDPGMDPREVVTTAREQDFQIEAIVLTHAHADHILGIDQVLAAFPDTALVIHKSEEDWLGDPALNLSAAFGSPYSAPKPTRVLTHGESLQIGDECWEVRHTPGHSPGGCSFVAPGGRLAIVGDTLFSGSIGRTDLPGGDFDQLAQSIRRELYSLDAECLCLPGHGPTTTIGQERQHNPFVRR